MTIVFTVSITSYGSRGPLFEGRIGDRLIVHSTTQPLLDASRVLLAEGIDPQTCLVLCHEWERHRCPHGQGRGAGQADCRRA
jgi:hypothetical protein